MVRRGHQPVDATWRLAPAELPAVLALHRHVPWLRLVRLSQGGRSAGASMSSPRRSRPTPWPMRVYEGEPDGAGVTHAAAMSFNNGCVATACGGHSDSLIFYTLPATHVLTCLACLAFWLQES